MLRRAETDIPYTLGALPGLKGSHFSLSLAIVLLAFALAVQETSQALMTTQNNAFIHNSNFMNVQFQGIDNEKIERSFMTVMQRYEKLHGCKVILVQKRLGSSTMKAQPVINLGQLFGHTDEYRVTLAEYVRDSDSLRVADLPEEVLTGWFAHELGHLVDYRPNSNWKMIVYGARYILSSRFKREAEHAADRIAIQHGFREKIIATKKFILAHEMLGDAYKAKIIRYYMSVDDAEVWEHEHVPGAPKIE